MDHADLIQYLNAVWDNMDQTVYGQLAAKCEIMEYLVARLLGNNTPRVLGLVGPPGVGKTLLGVKCVAKALNQSFHPITVGGLRDVTYFNGSLRCWKGAHHGVFADILSVHGGKLVVFVDELDKIASETASDVYGFLTHALDPMCNDQIHDFYLGINLNLQQVTFVLSYNDPSILPRPLRDRIKEIQMPAFDLNQKLEIVETFLIPELLGHYGISPALLTFPKTVIEYANNRIESNAMQVEAQEGGVRNLKKGYQGLVDKLMVSLISDYQSYQSLRTLRRTGQLPSAVAREVKTSNSTHSSPKVTKSRTKFAPYLATTPIQLPYTVTINDINRCLPSYK
jgi:ATP-dependent Lon protease